MGYSAAEWVTMIGAVAAAVVSVITALQGLALRGQLDENAERLDGRARELRHRIDEHEGQSQERAATLLEHLQARETK